MNRQPWSGPRCPQPSRLLSGSRSDSECNSRVPAWMPSTSLSVEVGCRPREPRWSASLAVRRLSTGLTNGGSMSLASLVAAGLPLNRKERFYTGTVFPAIVCAEGFAYFGRLANVIPGCPAFQVDARPRSANVQVFTEYGLWESIFGEAARKRFTVPPTARDTPDILVYLAVDPPVLIALEAKMYDRPTREALQEQMGR